jgi:hypothetical protein
MKAILIAAGVVLLISGASSATQKTLVPAFFGLGQTTDGTTADWTRIANQGSAVLAVVALGDSGGFETCGSGSCSVTAARSQFVTNHNAGQLVLGYVRADFACTSTTNLSARLTAAETGTFGVDAWYTSSRYPTQIDGIFYDIGPQSFSCPSGTDLAGQSPQSESTQKTYYSQAYNYVVSNHSNAKVMLNASQYENDWIVATGTYKSADYAIIFERNYNTWYNSYVAGNNTTPAWWTSGYSGKLANVIYDTTQYDIATGVTHSQGSTYGSPVMYFYDGNSTAYDHLSCSFEAQVALLQGTTPVPTAKTFCSGACHDLDSDIDNCGSCGNVCPGGGGGAIVECLSGSCNFYCDVMYQNCYNSYCVPYGTSC